MKLELFLQRDLKTRGLHIRQISKMKTGLNISFSQISYIELIELSIFKKFIFHILHRHRPNYMQSINSAIELIGLKIYFL